MHFVLVNDWSVSGFNNWSTRGCNAPQHIVVHCRIFISLSTLLLITLNCTTWPYSVTDANMSWPTTTHGNTPQHSAAHRKSDPVPQFITADCTSTQHTMACCSALPCTAAHSKSLQLPLCLKVIRCYCILTQSLLLISGFPWFDLLFQGPSMQAWVHTLGCSPTCNFSLHYVAVSHLVLAGIWRLLISKSTHPCKPITNIYYTTW